MRTPGLPPLARYDALDPATAIRPLDATEHNMERLNRLGRGCSLVYQIVRVRGDLPLDALRAAVDALAGAHELLSARIVVDPTTRELWFARGAAPPSVIELRDVDVARWTEVVEADMNRGAADTARGPMLAVARLGPGREHVLVLAAHHVICDAISLAALADQLLALVAGGPAPPPRPARELRLEARDDDARLAGLRRDVLDPLRARCRSWELLADGDPDKASAHDAILRELEALEDTIVAHAGTAPLPQLLIDLHALLAPIAGWRAAKTPIVPEVDVAGIESKATLLHHVVVAEETTAAVLERARGRGLTGHGPLGAAVLLATALRHLRITGRPPRSIPIGSPVSLRSRVSPPLEPVDLRMAVDVAFTPTEVGTETPFWEIAASFGRAVSREVRCGRPVTSWFATQRRDLDAPLRAVPIAMISNVGPSAVRERHGALEVVDVCAAMATHGVFQINSLFTGFRGRLSICVYVEAPAVSRASLDRFVADVERVLAAVARGDDPTLRGLSAGA